MSDLCFGLQGDPGFVFHHANAFEAREGRVVVDAIRYPTLPDFDQACGSGRHFEQVCVNSTPLLQSTIKDGCVWVAHNHAFAQSTRYCSPHLKTKLRHNSSPLPGVQRCCTESHLKQKWEAKDAAHHAII